jgi:hypothetical protein
VSASASVSTLSTRYDAARRRLSWRTRRQRGCNVYIPAEVLRDAGFDPVDAPPFYRVHGYARSRNAGSVIVSLYREP